MRVNGPKRWAVIGAAALALPLALSACGSSGGSSDSASGGTLTVSMSEPQTLLPSNVQDAESVQPVSVIYTGLVSYTDKGESVNQMADSITSTDNKIWDIKIKSGWTFHDGTPVTSSSYID